MPFLKDIKKITYSRTREIEKTTEKNGIHAVYTKNRWYKGDWVEEKKEGLGRLFSDNENHLYEGDWKKNKISGFGITANRLLNGIYQLEYKGFWENNTKNGFGWQIYPNGDIFFGEFIKSKRWGFGRLYFPDGGYFYGFFENDMKNGYGVLYNATTGNRYEGYFKDDFKHGYGKLIYNLTGQIFIGIWIKGIFKCGGVEDYHARQNARLPTPYPIPPITLLDFNTIDENQRRKAIEGQLDDCLKVE